jgi:hypothetical protein
MPYKGQYQTIWCTSFFISRIDLASAAYPYQSVCKPDGSRIKIEELLGFVQEEFTDFILLEDINGQATITPSPQINCERCSRVYELAGNQYCPDCKHPNFYQVSAQRLTEIRDDLTPSDPILRNMLRQLEERRTQNAYKDTITQFETFHKRLNEYLFSKAGRQLEKPKPPNLFQNIEGTQSWFRDSNRHNCDTLAGIDQANQRGLRLVAAKRHVLTHNGGLIDRKYVDAKVIIDGIDPKTLSDEEIARQLGQPVPVEKSEILRAIQTVLDLIEHARILI